MGVYFCTEWELCYREYLFDRDSANGKLDMVVRSETFPDLELAPTIDALVYLWHRQNCRSRARRSTQARLQTWLYLHRSSSMYTLRANVTVKSGLRNWVRNRQVSSVNRIPNSHYGGRTNVCFQMISCLYVPAAGLGWIAAGRVESRLGRSVKAVQHLDSDDAGTTVCLWCGVPRHISRTIFIDNPDLCTFIQQLLIHIIIWLKSEAATIIVHNLVFGIRVWYRRTLRANKRAKAARHPRRPRLLTAHCKTKSTFFLWQNILSSCKGHPCP